MEIPLIDLHWHVAWRAEGGRWTVWIRDDGEGALSVILWLGGKGHDLMLTSGRFDEAFNKFGTLQDIGDGSDVEIVSVSAGNVFAGAVCHD